MEQGQYGQHVVGGSPSAYISMRDYRNQSWQSHQPVERNPNEYRSMRDYGNQWMSSPYGNSYHHSWENHTNSSWEARPPQYAPPEPSCYAPTSQQQQPPPLSLVEQAILNLSKQVDNFIEDNRAVNVQANREIETVEGSLNKELDGFQSEIDQKLDILQESISKLAQQPDHKGEENPEDEWTGTILGEQVQMQPQEELKMESVEAPEELQDAPESSVNFWPWTKEEQISALITEESSGHETGEEPQEPILQPIPMKLNPNATAQPQNNPLPVAPSDNQVYILPSPAPKSTHAAPAPNHKSTLSLPMLKNFKRLVAIVQNFATTSNKMAAAHTAWHSGWFECRCGFGAPEPWHF